MGHLVLGCRRPRMTECRAVSRLAPCQWEMSLRINAVSHWQGTNLEPTMSYRHWKQRVGMMPTLSSHWWHCRFLSWKPVLPFSWHRNPSALLGHLRGSYHLPKAHSFEAFFAVSLNKLSNKQSICCWLETQWLVFTSIFSSSVVPFLPYILPVSLWSVPLFCINMDVPVIILFRATEELVLFWLRVLRPLSPLPVTTQLDAPFPVQCPWSTPVPHSATKALFFLKREVPCRYICNSKPSVLY